MKKIIINPHIDVQYAAYYIVGLKRVFGARNVRFARKSEMHRFVVQEKILNVSFLVLEKNKMLKVSIDHGDFNAILHVDTYDWADIYGKVNTNLEITPYDKYPKLICLATNFGIKAFSICESIYYSLRNYAVVKPANIKRYFAQYIKQKNKIRITDYPISKAKKGYVFSVNTLWYSDAENKLDETTNKIRADFMDTCIALTNIDFEGGFVPSQLGNDNFRHLHIKKRISQEDYLSKAQHSVFAFNTPAVWNCHGWKLGEFLCMGKAIISTPLSNELPASLVHAESIHIVENQQQLIDAIDLINNDDKYRSLLEKNAREYYQKYVSPEASIKLLGIV